MRLPSFLRTRGGGAAALLDLRRELDAVREAVLRVEHVATESAVWSHPRRQRGVDQLAQHLARLEWRRLLGDGGPLPGLDEVEFRLFSQNGEDGILWFLFSLIGDGFKRSAEICAGDGVESCTANLIVNHGWEGLLVEGDAALVNRGCAFFEHSADTWYAVPRFVNQWVTAANVGALLEEHGFARDLDLLVIDLDGNDYWIWKAIEVRPRVVVVEVNHALGPEPSVAMPYDEDFRGEKGSHYRSASLRAFVKLGEARGYRFVGVQRYGFNAFFVREDCCPDQLPVATIESCFAHPRNRDEVSRFAGYLLAHHEWVEV